MDRAGPQPGHYQSGTREGQKPRVSLKSLSCKFHSVVLYLVTLIIKTRGLYFLIALFFLVVSSKSIDPWCAEGGQSPRSLAGAKGSSTAQGGRAREWATLRPRRETGEGVAREYSHMELEESGNKGRKENRPLEVRWKVEARKWKVYIVYGIYLSLCKAKGRWIIMIIMANIYRLLTVSWALCWERGGNYLICSFQLPAGTVICENGFQTDEGY